VRESLLFFRSQIISKHSQPKPNLKSNRRWPRDILDSLGVDVWEKLLEWTLVKLVRKIED